jgi:probable HAF family extracellular repeat protein
MSTFTRNRVLIAVAAGVVNAALTVAAVAAAPAQKSRWVDQVGLARVAAASSTDPRSQTPLFVLDKGRFTAFDIPFGEFGGDGLAINNRGQIVGGYYSGPAETCLRGFLRDHTGRFTRIDYPAVGFTQLLDINDSGQIVGSFQPSPCSGTAPLRGFLRDKRGRFTTIRIPGAVQVQAIGLNNRGQVVGGYVATDGTPHGYLWDHGRITTVDGPANATATVFDINDNGQMVGVYFDAAGGSHAFALSNGRYTTIDAPGVAFTLPFGINNRGQIAGLTVASLPLNETSDAHGFVLRNGAGGPFTRIDVPGAVFGTAVFHINDAGAVVGIYGNPNAANPESVSQRPAGGMQSLGMIRRTVR